MGGYLVKGGNGFPHFPKFGVGRYGFELGNLLRLPLISRKAEVDLFDPRLAGKDKSAAGGVTAAERLEKREW
jgi:hypothetical protein